MRQEREKVYLVKKLPDDLDSYRSIIIKAGNFYDPNALDSLVVKQRGDRYELVKKIR